MFGLHETLEGFNVIRLYIILEFVLFMVVLVGGSYYNIKNIAYYNMFVNYYLT